MRYRQQEDTAWKARGLCRGVDPDLFYPDRGGDVSSAQKICAQCPVREECAEYGLHEKFGIWGGTTERGRRKARRERYNLRVSA